MNNFYFDLENGDTVQVEYETYDEDERGNIEFEFSVYNQAGKDFWNDISEKDRQKIEAETNRNWQQFLIDERKDIAADQWAANRDGF